MSICGTIMTMADIRLEAQAGRLGAVMIAVLVEGHRGKEYRLPTEHEKSCADQATSQLRDLFADIPFGLPQEPLPGKEALGFRVPVLATCLIRAVSLPG